ncbi:hypothetical protein [Parasphingorhabdus pacifica]
MYELSRVRLYSVGPPGARYEDVTVDLSQAGKPVQHAQPTLLDEGGVFRPSAASVLFLENGGGKSVLIKLIFSVMLPGKRQIVGTSNTRILEKFVERGDVAHVVLEWMHTETGRLLITGKVSEWRARKNAAEDGLAEVWYSLRPTSSTGIASLPFAEDGENLVASEFQARLNELADHDPSLELFWADRHGKWADRLVALGLDPELFEFQRRMNAGEGEAAETFTFASDEALIEFLLKAVTPTADVTTLAESLEQYASTLSTRDALELERDFVAAVLDHLAPLAERHTAAETAQQRVTSREIERDRFVAAVMARIKLERARSKDQQSKLDQAQVAVESARKDQVSAKSVQDELARRVARFRMEEAEEAFKTADSAARDATALVEAWEATGPLIDWTVRDQTARQLRDVLREKRHAETAALRVRDTRAGELVCALLDAEDHARHKVNVEDSETARLIQETQQKQDELDKAITARANARATAERFDGAIAEVDAEVASAVSDGLIQDAESVPTAADTLAETARAAAASAAQQETRLAEIDEGVDNAQAALVVARSRESTAVAEHDKASAAISRAQETMGALATESRLMELVEGDEVALELDAERLVEALTEALASVDRDRIGIRVAEAADERARLALESGDDALYPPPPEVEDLVQLLRDEQVRCYSGWDVLADFPDPDTRRELVTRLPHLAAGVLLNDPGDLDRARQLVAERGYEPTRLVAIASTQSFDLDPDEHFDLIPTVDAGFIVLPNQALYDHQAARAESVRINERYEQRQHQISELNDRYVGDQRLRARLLQWREEYPPGRLGELTGRLSAATEGLATVREMVRSRVNALEEAKRFREQARSVLTSLTRDAGEAEARATRAGKLRARVADAANWRQEAQAARKTEHLEGERAAELSALRDRRRAEASEHQRAADQHRSTVVRLREEIVQAGGDSLVDRGAQAPAQPLPVLRRLLHEAEIAYLKAQVGSDLLSEVATATKAASEAKASVDRLSESARARAEELLKTPESADAAGRAAAFDVAKARQSDAAQARDAAVSTLGQRKARFVDLPAPSSPVVLAVEPLGIGHAEQLLSDAEAACREVEAAVAVKENELAVMASSLHRTDQILAGFTRITDALATADDLRTDSQIETKRPYDGDPDTAWQRHIELAQALKQARKERGEALKLVNTTVDVLRTAVAETRFHTLVSAARTQITTVPPSELPQHAETWSASLRPRLRALTEDLAQSDRHRALIIGRLKGMVENALRTLRQAQRLSRLPAGLGDWAGEEFLRFVFKPAEGEVLTQQLAQVVDEAAQGKAAKRDGMSLLLRGVRSAAPRGFKVTMLKPDAVLRTERVRVSEVHDVFSGGQHLTAAIMLYCTLAALRANNQGKAHQRHSGVLFLDNPIGRASASYLLDLQRAVASALGVQLVYTTGLFDAEALGNFPLIVRLRNDADLRAGRKYLSVDTRVKAVLDSLTEPDDTARLSASRVTLKERQRDNEE